MGTLSVRIPEDMERELKEVVRDEKLEQASEAARKVLAIGLECTEFSIRSNGKILALQRNLFLFESWRQEKALALFEQGKVTFLKAAKIAKLNLWDFAALVQEKKIVWVKDQVITEDIARAMRFS